jgi:PAS domain S-box-containing protein
MVKAVLIAVPTGLIIFGITAYLSNQFAAGEYKKHYREKANLIWTHIIDDIEQAMIARAHDFILKTLNLYREYEEVKEVRVFNEKGREVFSPQPGPPDPRVEETLRTGGLAQFHKMIGGREVDSYVIPLRNKPECHQCHDKNEKVRGALLLSVSKEKMRKDMALMTRKYYFLLAFVFMAMSLTAVFSANRVVLRPLRRLQKGTEAIAKGDLRYRIPVETRDEFGNLTANFNIMAGKLQSLFEELGQKNIQLSEQFTLCSISQKEWQETFDCITDQISVVDTQFNIVKANRAFREYLSLPPDGPINKKCYEIVSTCSRSNCPHGKSIMDNRPVTEERRDAKTGNIFQVSVFPYYSPGGEYLGSIFIGKDVTAAKENEMRLIMNERLAALGQMASGIAHEINNPLATISACAEGLLARIEKENIGSLLFESYLRMIEEEVNRCKKITMSMLSFVRKPSGEKQAIHVHETLEKAVEMLDFQGRMKEVEVIRNYQQGLPLIHLNEGGMIQVFHSIIGNALDAMDGRGTLTLETGDHAGETFVIIGDTGPGIPPDQINRIFDPFFTTKGDRGGTGLGLSIADKIVKENRGKMEVVSEEGKGARFKIIFPV